jgi:hypothetical protein
LKEEESIKEGVYVPDGIVPVTQRISETFSICPAQFEIISKALGKRFGMPRTFGFENGRHDICVLPIQR